MDYGEKNKKIKALQIVGALSYIALNNLDRVNVNILEEDSLYEIKGGTGKKVFQNILKELENIEKYLFSRRKTLCDKTKGKIDFFHFTCHLFSFRIGFVYIYNYTEQNRNLQ